MNITVKSNACFDGLACETLKDVNKGSVLVGRGSALYDGDS